MIKYIGSKRTLVPLIQRLVEQLPVGTACDLFAGTTRVGQGLRRLGLTVHSNDLATYSEALGQAYIAAGESLDRTRLERILEELSALAGRDGYFTETFCRRARYLQPENGARVDAIRDAIDGYDLSPVERGVLLTALLEAADRVDSTTGLQMAYLKAWAPRSYNPLELRLPEPVPGPVGDGVAPRCERARAAARRRPRLRRPAVQPALVLLQLPRVGNPRALGRAGDVRRREQARGLPRASERLQLEARGAGRAGRADRGAPLAMGACFAVRRGFP